MRTTLVWGGVFAATIMAVVSLPLLFSGPSELPGEAEPEPVLTTGNAAELCAQLFVEPKGYVSDAALQRRWAIRRESCKTALDADPGNTQLKVNVARDLPYARKREAIETYRDAAARGNAEANYQLYEHHKTWERGDLDKEPLVGRAEAGQALIKAAELGHSYSTRLLANLLDRGETVKRDPVAARYWAERALDHPDKDASKGDLSVLLGRLLATSGNPEERARGLDLLERAATAGVFGAGRELARAVRREDPVRARKLLEEARRTDPGGAIAPLAEMLIAGEGGPADPKRALSLLQGTSDNWMASGLLGRLTLEGKWVPRDIQGALTLIQRAATWEIGARMLVLQLLTEHPELRVSDPKSTLYSATEAAELGEPGAMDALIGLKLSGNPQFQDRPGACKLIEAAVSRGDQGMTQRLTDCRAS